MKSLLLALIQTAPTFTIQTVPPAPPAPPGPPPIVRAPMRTTMRPLPGGESYTVEIEVRAGSELLWSGSLRVATGQPSRFARSQSEPPPAGCAPAARRGAENAFTFSLMPNYGYDADNLGRASLSVRWSRAGEGGCAEGGATRTVELNQEVTLTPGASVSVRGDAGLTVTLRRR